jgi:NaMN:DMB phosphoribosyltransferase
MFGAMDYLGQVQFSDAVFQGTTEILLIPSLSAPHPREQLYYEEGQVKGRKFYMHGRDGKTARGNVPVEACPIGSRFPLLLHFENLSRGQLALLLIAMGQGTPRLVPKLGCGKPACCGSIEMIDVAVSTVDTQSSAKEFDFESVAENLSTLLATTSLVNVDNLLRLAAILAYPGERACPDRNY